ncbi:YeeE/YedE family protein, partial [Candidatus Pacearchaeota archaeon]|nr:YeeE/YedE family protein [Candidatus Pacearchaeota archaeon]
MLPVIATLAIGGLIGYMGQRSRFCIVSGIRDLFISRNVQRFMGLVGLIIGAVFGFMIFGFFGGTITDFPMPIQLDSAGYLVVSIIGGISIGFFSVLAEGCPFRQHVMAAEGRESAMFYLLGFYIG